MFGAWIGGVWAFGFLGGWAFLGTTLGRELKDITVDSIPLAVAGVLIGLLGALGVFAGGLAYERLA